MQAIERKRIEVAVEAHHVPHIRNCLEAIAHEDFTVSPIISGWNARGYWSSEYAFGTIGQKVMVRFTADAQPLRPLLAAGFGILLSDILVINATAVPN